MCEHCEGHPAPPGAGTASRLPRGHGSLYALGRSLNSAALAPMCEVKREGYLSLVGLEWQAAQEMGNYMC